MSMNRKHEERLLEERRECAQALLNRPWIFKGEDPAMFQQIKKHYDWLRDWFQEHCGFPLLLTRSFVKLEKVPAVAHRWMGFVDFSHPRDYGLFIYILWFLEEKGEHEQFLLSELAEELREYLLTQRIELDWRNYYHRLSMARALRKLRDLSVLIALDGEENKWAQNSEQNVLYECSPLIRYVVRRFTKDVTACQEPEQLVDDRYPETEEGRRDQLRHRVYRRLVQEAVVLDREWNEAERHYVLTQRRSIMANLNLIGFEAVRFREGLLVTYPEASGDLVLFPTPKGVTDLVLLFAADIRQRLLHPESPLSVQTHGQVPLSWAELEQILFELKEQHGVFWSKKHREMTSAQLAQLISEHLLEWKLAVQDESGLLIEPVLGRWSGHYPKSET